MMRLIFMATLIFIFNTAFMPLLGMTHELSHENNAQIHWDVHDNSNGLFEIIHDDHHDGAESTVAVDHINKHQCHHFSVIGILTIVSHQIGSSVKSFNMTEPLFSIQTFPNFIEYPPNKNLC
jgi:hypothetical protein